MGGEDTVHNIIKDEGKQLYARFPSQNALQSSIVGARTGTGGALVLRLRRKKNGTGRTQVDVVGRVDHAYSFHQPAEYQFLPESVGLQLIHTNQNTTAMAVEGPSASADASDGAGAGTSTGMAGNPILILIYYHYHYHYPPSLSIGSTVVATEVIVQQTYPLINPPHHYHIIVITAGNTTDNEEQQEEWTVLETIPRPFYSLPEKELIFKEFETKLQKRRDWKESGHKPKDNLLQVSEFDPPGFTTYPPPIPPPFLLQVSEFLSPCLDLISLFQLPSPPLPPTPHVHTQSHTHTHIHKKSNKLTLTLTLPISSANFTACLGQIWRTHTPRSIRPIHGPCQLLVIRHARRHQKTFSRLGIDINTFI